MGLDIHPPSLVERKQHSLLLELEQTQDWAHSWVRGSHYAMQGNKLRFWLSLAENTNCHEPPLSETLSYMRDSSH